jgi:SAM-dependent methyltransferase
MKPALMGPASHLRERRGKANSSLDSGSELSVRFSSPDPADDPSARWEAFARHDPQFYIDPTLGRDVDAAQFIEAGRGVVEQVLEWTGELRTYDRALEIGCGIGRDTVHLARHFRHVDGVDVSETMVRRARDT